MDDEKIILWAGRLGGATGHILGFGLTVGLYALAVWLLR
jgi:hypothetical protein